MDTGKNKLDVALDSCAERLHVDNTPLTTMRAKNDTGDAALIAACAAQSRTIQAATGYGRCCGVGWVDPGT
jgi:hypothetical protein